MLVKIITEVEVPTASCILNLKAVVITGTMMIPPPMPIMPLMMPIKKPKIAKRIGSSFASSSPFGCFPINILTPPRPITTPNTTFSISPEMNLDVIVDPISAPITPKRPKVIPAFHNTDFFFVCAHAPLIAVGKTTRRLDPNASLIAMSVGTPIEVNTKNVTGTMMKHPPTPRSP
ncbi:MAG: hypothetical protein MASP_01551 [Candidatus Methanolliviera sp. GoM_asphalt]|nr:MAG: hypothetical protein MASP_01551 [Candidatus Methanolliviera sp. GoM_asphalt]